MAFIAVFLALAQLVAAPYAETKTLSSNRHSVLLMSTPFPGHTAVPMALGEELVRRGHNVTYFTILLKDDKHFKQRATNARMGFLSGGFNMTYDEVVLSTVIDSTPTYIDAIFAAYNKLATVTYLLQETMRISEAILDCSSIMNDIDVIVATDIMLPVAACLSKKWKLPHVSLSNTLDIFPQHSVIFHPRQPSDNVGIVDRLLFVIESSILSILMPVFVKLTAQRMASCSLATLEMSHAPGVTIPHIIPTVIGFEYPRPLSPLTSYVGPILSPQSEPLTTELQQWLDNQGDSTVIYISLGSLLSPSKLVATAFMQGVGMTGHSVIWSLKKSNRDILKGLEFNGEKMLILDWAPQLAILRHRSISMAILHGGMNGVHEALDSGVPIIVLPVFGDQWGNAARLVHHGLGIQLDHTTVTGAQLAESIRTIENGEYRSHVKKLQKSFRLAGGVAKAGDLVEFYVDVGYDHLIPAYAKYNWSWIQYYNLDVYCLLLSVAGLLIWINLRLWRYGYQKCCKHVDQDKERPKKE